MYRETWTPCVDPRPCIHKTFRAGGYVGCKILKAGVNGEPPYEPNKCAWCKEEENEKP